VKKQPGSTFCGERLLEAGSRGRPFLWSRRAYPLRTLFLEMTQRREALRCRARLNLLTPLGLYSAH